VAIQTQKKAAAGAGSATALPVRSREQNIPMRPRPKVDEDAPVRLIDGNQAGSPNGDRSVFHTHDRPRIEPAPRPIRSGLPFEARLVHCRWMGAKSRESIYGSSVRASAERAKEARKVADRLACEAWNQRMLGFKGPAQPSPSLGDALNAGDLYLEVRCLGCDTPIHELERYMRCKDCSQVRGYPYKRSHLVALRPTKISASIHHRHGGREVSPSRRSS
jgi:hypothetical protein